MATYTELTARVKDWANRTDLSDDIIGDFLDISVKRVNNILRIPPMETIVRYTGLTAEQTTLAVPSDLIEVIELKILNADETVKTLFEAKDSTRAFDSKNGNGSWTGSVATFTRRAGDFVLSQKLDADDIVELYYYRVLPALDATYPSTELNCTTVGSVAAGTWSNPGGEGVCDPVGGGLIGDEVPNWFRDEQDDLLLYGALTELFNYLGEASDATRWNDKYEFKLTELKDEENKRTWSGGTIVSNIITNGLI